MRRFMTCVPQYTKLLLHTVKQLQNSQANVQGKIYKLVPTIQPDMLISKKLSQNEVITDKEWFSIREELLNNFSEYEITEVNVNSLIYDICNNQKKYDTAISYYKFLESNNYNLDINTIKRYLKFLYLHYVDKDNVPEEEIYRVYDKLRATYPILDGKTSSDCIYAISITGRWREALELLDIIRIADQPTPSVYSAIIAAALKNNDVELAFKCIHDVYTSNNSSLDHSIYIDYLNYCMRNYKSKTRLEAEVEKIFYLWNDLNFVPRQNVIKEYSALYKRLGYMSYNTSISPNGHCHQCSSKLSDIVLNDDDFKVLSSSILKNLIIGKNVYFGSSPQELKRYLLFVKTMKPYDVVIDGLNVAYSCNTKSRDSTKPKHGLLENVINVVNQFRKDNKRVLVIGRAHMNWWSKETMNKLNRLADVYLTGNLSKDDPFLLHITLISGANTYFVSKDIMRQHRPIDPELEKLFQRWRQSRQYTFKFSKNSDIQLIPPITIKPTAQKDENGWHIPYVVNTQIVLPKLYGFPRHWVCFRRKNPPKHNFSHNKS